MEWKHCPLSKDGQLYVNENIMFFCIIIQRKVIKLSYSANTNICVSVSSDITDWDSINWNRVERYVDKQQKRIYKAEVNKDKRNFIGKWTLIGPTDKNQLVKMSKIPIRRWNMIKHNYSPYDESKEEYFENRFKYQFSRR